MTAPTGSTLNTGESVMTASLFTFAQHTATQNFSLTLPVPMPTGVVLNGESSSDVSPIVPVTSNTAPINISVDRADCTGGTGTVTVTMADGTILNQIPPGVSGDLTESPSSPGHFTASIPPPYPSPYPTHGTATVSISFTCGGATAAPTTFTLYVDPSGVVQDINTGNGIAGAAVTLLHSAALAGPFTAAPSGSDIMSPSNRANPDTSDGTGHYGWDVTAGYYKVQAQAPDCYAPNSYSDAGNTVQPLVTSLTQQIPPAVTNLNLLLDCTNIRPVASFTQPTSAAVGAPVHFDATASKDANGSVASYSWNFGDGTTGIGATPSHTYSTSGSFTPTLTVTDDQGLTSLLKAGSTIAVSGPPGTIGNLSAISGVHSVNLSWAAPADNGSPVTGYTVDVSPGGQHLTTTGTSVTVSGLTANTSYTFTVRAVSALGSSPSATTSALAGAAANKPTVTITSKPRALTNSTSGIVRFTTTVDSSARLTSVTCSFDAGAETACTSPNTVSGLADGSHTVVVTATDSDGNHGSASAQWVVDTTAATANMVQPASTTALAKRFGVSWGGADANGIASFDVQYSKAAWNGKFGAPTLWTSGTTATSSSFTGVPGYEYCFSVRSQDKAGNVSGYGATKCTAIPLDDRSLAASAGWKKLTGKTFFLGTAMQAAANGKTLTRKGATAGRAVLYVDKGKGFGTITVLYNGKVVKKISLASTRLVTKFAVALPKVTKTTTIVIKTTSAKKVQIDGLLLARI
ncbi:MAG: PKD domain-containing protein [Chloroflexota bacterium]